jgi:predicted transcriptional regulator
MSTAKEEVRKMLDRLPDDSSLEDIQYHIYVREKIAHGLQDIEAGRLLAQEEVERRMSKWLGGRGNSARRQDQGKRRFGRRVDG